MKKVYFIYVYLPIRYLEKFPYLIDERDIKEKNKDNVLAFYGFTDNKSFLLDFMNTRDKSIFFYEKRKMCSHDYYMLVRKKKLHELRRNIFSYNEVILDSELFMIEFHRNELIEFYCNSLSIIPIEMFSDKYAISLFSMVYPFNSIREEISSYMTETDPIILYMICFHVFLDEYFYLNIIKNIEKEKIK